MTSWYFPINDDQFLFVKALNDGDKESVDIRDSYSFALGDRVYVYRPFPDNCIEYEMEVVLTGIRFEESADKVDFWRDPESYYNGLMTTPYCRLKIVRKIDNPELTATNLKAHGLRNIFSVDVLPDDTLAFILRPILDDSFGVDYPEENEFYEGALMTVEVNKYERSRTARDMCIALKGCCCAVCGLDFGKRYGPAGRGFIHVHHLVPISTIGKEYKLDIENDLVPVCPNCHYMLHRKPGGVYTIAELKAMLQE